MDIIELYDIVLSVLTSRMFLGKTSVDLPSDELVLKMIRQTKVVFKEEKSLLELGGEFIVVGDMHGNIDDLLRIFEKHSYPPDKKYLFLGDYVDRGSNSVEVMLLLFALKNLYKDHIFLLRGNHECQDINSVYGFQKECEMKLGYKAYTAFIKCFSYMPFAAVLNHSIFCVHGGISPDVVDLKQIKDLQRPMLCYDSLVSNGILWSDPRMCVENYEPSDRGTGYLFSAKNLCTFLKHNKLELLIRSHESCQDGFDWPFGKDGKCLTVFSNSDYCGMSNSAAVVNIYKNNEITFNLFEPITDKNANIRHVLVPEWIFKMSEVPTNNMKAPEFDDQEDAFFDSLIDECLDIF